MYRFHASIHPLPPDVARGKPVELRGELRKTLDVPPHALAQPLEVSFEEAAAQMAMLPRLFLEPDGSFVWVSSDEHHPWQVDGNLYDRGQRLQYVDIKGACPAEAFDHLLACFGWPDTLLMFQLARQAVFLDEQTFRQYAAAKESPAE